MQSKIQDFTVATEVAMKELEEVAKHVREQHTHYLKIKSAEVRVENSMKDIVKEKMYFTEETEDLMYQYKYLKLTEHEIVDTIFKYCAIKEGNSLHLEDSKLQVLMEALFEQVATQAPKELKKTRNNKEVEVDLPPRKKLIEEKLIDLKFKLEPGFEMNEIDLFWPNFTVITDKYEKEKLREWLDDPNNIFFYKNYARAMLNFNPKDSLRTQAKYPDVNKGKEAGEIECIYLYLYFLFQRIRKMEKSPERNTLKFKRAYEHFAEAFLYCGLLHYKSNTITGMPILKFFYTLLDCYPTFRTYCYRRVQDALKMMSLGGEGRNNFKAELNLQKDDTVIKDLVMILLMEFDITSEEFLYTLNLLEYLCDGNPQFNYLGLFLGDFYDFHLIGALKYADDDKRLMFYETAEKAVYKSPNSSGSEEDKKLDQSRTELLTVNAKARLIVMYQLKLDQLFTEQEASKNARKIDEQVFLGYYKKIFDMNKELLKINHPIALMFQADHFIKSNQYKLNPDLTKVDPELDKGSFFILQRGFSITKAAEVLNILFLMGDTVHNNLYYRVLKQLRLQEVIFPAMRIVGDGGDENLYIPLAYCKEKGIGGSIDNEFALDTYRKAVSQYIEHGDLYKIGQVIYRVGQILKRGSNESLAEQYYLTALIYMLQSNLDRNLDKRFIYQVATILVKFKDETLQEYGRALLHLSYKIYPKKPVEYLLHYEIERELNQDHQQYVSKTKQSMSAVFNVLKMETSFISECLRRKEQTADKKDAYTLIGKLKDITINMLNEKFSSFAQSLSLSDKTKKVSEADLLHCLENLEKGGYMEKDIKLSLLRMSAKILSTERNTEIEKKFRQIKEKKKQINEGQVEARSPKRQTEYMIQQLARNNPDVITIDLSSVEKVPDDINNYEKIDLTEPCLHYETYRFKDTQQRCTRITVQYDDVKGAKNFLDNFEFFLTYNPFLLNYYGLNYDQDSEGIKTKWTIYLYAEYFDKTANAWDPSGVLVGKKLPLDKMFKIAYQLILAIRSLHVIGKVSYFISNQFIALTPDLDVHLIVPFFEPYFKEPSSFIEKCEAEGNFLKYSHMAPENFAYLDSDEKGATSKNPNTTEFKQTQLENLSQRCDYFPLLQNEANSILFEFCAFNDIWSLGIFLLELFSSKPFYDPRMFSRGKDFIKFMNNIPKVKSHVDSKLKTLPSELPQSLKNLIYKMLRVNPLRRPTIESVLSVFQYVIFNQLYSIPPATPKEMNKLFYKNAFFDIVREGKVEKSDGSVYEEVKIRLPKGYIYEGKAIRGIPNGKGFISHKGLKLLSADFEDGVICGSAAFKLGHRDFLEVKDVVSNVPKPKRDHQGSENAGYSRGMVLYNRNQPNKEETPVSSFERNTWLPDRRILKERFAKFCKFDKVSKVESRNKRKIIANKSLTDAPAHLRKNSMNISIETKKDLLQIIIPQIGYWVSDLNRKKESAYMIFTSQKSRKNREIMEGITRFLFNQPGSPNYMQGLGDQGINADQIEKKIVDLSDLSAKDLQEELHQYLDFVAQSCRNYDFRKKGEEEVRTDNEQLRKEKEEEAERENADNLVQAAFSSFLGNSQLRAGSLSNLGFGKKDREASLKEKTEEEEEKVDLDRYHTMVVDAFGNCLRLYFDRRPEEQQEIGKQGFDYSKGITITHLETCRLFQIAAFNPSICANHVFVSRVSNFAVCDIREEPTSFGSLLGTLNKGRFFFSIITELKDKQFRGAITDQGPEIGTLYIADKDQHIAFQRGSGDSYKGMVVDLKHQTEYEGSIIGTKKHGFGKLKYKDRLVYIGNFKDGVPHGKGLFLNDEQKIIFKGIFKDGKKKFGTTVAYPGTFSPISNPSTSTQEVKKPQANPDSSKIVNISLNEIPEATSLGEEDEGESEDSLPVTKPLENSIQKAQRESKVVISFSVEINGIYHLIPSSIKTNDDSMAPINIFLYEMTSGKADYVIEGSIRKKKEYPIYYSTFRGLLFDFNGPVKINFGKGAYFFGFFKNGIKTGLGVMFDQNGGKMLGQWSDSNLVGYYESKTKELRTGHFTVTAPGQFVQYGFGKMKNSEGRFYKGQIEDNSPSGYGFRREPNGNEYRGQFKDDEYEGYGSLDSPLKNCSFEGYFTNGKLNTLGIYRYMGSINKGYWENQTMKVLYSEDECIRVDNRIISSIISEVEYNRFEGSYTKKGACRIEFLKLIRPNRSINQVVSELVTLVMEVILLSKYKHKDAFKLAFFILEQLNTILLAEKKEYPTTEDIKSLNYNELVTATLKNIITTRDSGKFKVDVDFSRDTLKSLIQKYKYAKVMVDSIVRTVIYRTADVLRSENTDILAMVRRILTSELMDIRQKSQHEKLKEGFKKVLYSFVSPVIAELGRLLQVFERETVPGKKSRANSTEGKDGNLNTTHQQSMTDVAGLHGHSQTNLHFDLHNRPEENQSIREGSVAPLSVEKQHFTLKSVIPPSKIAASMVPSLNLGLKGNDIQTKIVRTMILDVLAPQDKGTDIGMKPLPSIHNKGAKMTEKELSQSQASRRGSQSTGQQGNNTSRSILDEPDLTWEEQQAELENVRKIVGQIVKEIDSTIPDFYEGEIFNDEVNGYGCLIAKDKVLYQGEFKENAPSGLGSMLLLPNWIVPDNISNTKVFLGIVEKDMPNGLGVLFDQSNHWEGKFVDGKRVGMVVCRYRGKMVSIGMYDKGVKQGCTLKLKSDRKKAILMDFEDGIVKSSSIIE